MTEIPEHLLKRSRAAKGKADPSASSEADSGSSDTAVTPAASAQAEAAGPPALATAAAATPADSPPPVEPPKPHYIQAAESRKKIPMWAMFMLAFVPLWAVSFGGTMQLPDVEDPLFTDATEVYNVTGGCSGCHGGDGGGGVGYKLSDGSVVDTFPHMADQMVHVARGSAAIAGESYGAVRVDGERRVAGSRGVMPASTTLTQLELELVVFHERVALSGEEVGAEYEEHLREKVEAGEGEELVNDEYFQLLLDCSDPEITPGATGLGAVDGAGDNLCPGPHLDE